MTRIGGAPAAFLASLVLWAGTALVTLSHASFPATSQPSVKFWQGNAGQFSTLLAACNSFIPGTNPGTGNTIESLAFVNDSNDKCVWNMAPGSFNGAVQDYQLTTGMTTPGFGCPSGSTLNGSLCTCTAPLVQNSANDACVPATNSDDQVCNDAALIDSTQFGSRDIQIAGKVPSGNSCFPTDGLSGGKGCVVEFSREASYQLPNGGWISEGTYRRKLGGGSCSVQTPSPEVPPSQPDTCKNGQPGQINGVTVCIPFSNHTPAETEKKTIKEVVTPSGTETTTETSTTVCTGAGSCVTTNVASVNNGTTTTSTTTTTTQSKAAYCKASPDSADCKGASSFSGNCPAEFKFEGDAIQGAIALEVHKQNCLMNATTDESAKYDAAKANTGDQTTNLPGNQSVAISSSSFNTTNALGAPSCITDLTITVLGSSVVLPLSSICPWLGRFRLILLAVAFFMAYRIVFRS